MNGQIRIGLRFSEAMDSTTSPDVRFQAADPTVPETEVVELSYEEDEWRGMVNVPPSPDAPDYNGMGTLYISQAKDLAGNTMESSTESYEVDLGPWFEVKAFANPVLKREILFHVRCHRHFGGPLENLAAAPEMEVKQENAPKQILALKSIQPAVYRGVYLINQNHPGQAKLLITGTDLSGNTVKRLISFSVAELIAADRFEESFGSLRVSLPENSISRDTCLALLPADTKDLDLPADQRELEIVHHFENVPQGPLLLKQKGVARCSLEQFKGLGAERRVGLFSKRGERWVYEKGVRNEDELISSISALGNYALAIDETPPRLSRGALKEGALRLDHSRASIEIPIEDGGSGVDFDSVLASIDGEPVEVGRARGGKKLEIRPLHSLRPGEHSLSISAKDSLGNARSWTLALKAPKPLALNSFLPVPNPARGPVTFHWELSQEARGGSLKVYDLAGHRVRRWAIGESPIGKGSLRWDLRNSRGRAVANGVYIARLTFEGIDGEKTRARSKIAVLR